MKTEIQIDGAVREKASYIQLGILQYHADVKKPDPSFWKMMDEEILPQVRSSITGNQWDEIPGVRGSRATYRLFGRSPSRFRVSSEALLRRVRRGDELYHINTVVDVNNMISVESGLSAGSYDLSAIQGPVVFRQAVQGEGYTGIGKDFIDMENMLVLADEKGIFGSTMSDSTRAMVTGGEREILTVIYCLEEGLDLRKLLRHAEEAFEKYAGAEDMKSWVI